VGLLDYWGLDIFCLAQFFSLFRSLCPSLSFLVQALARGTVFDLVATFPLYVTDLGELPIIPGLLSLAPL